MNIDQAARRAATKVWTLHMNGLPDVEATIAAEFAPLQAECDKWQMAYEEASERAASIGKRLAEAERLLGLAQALIPGGSSSSLWIRFEKFLAAKENGNG